MRAKTLTYFVSPLGSDQYDGRSADARKASSPFATLSRARDAARQAREEGFGGPVRIRIRGGVYYPTETLVLRDEDGAEEGSSVVWEAYKDEAPVLDGGRQITGWRLLEEKVSGLPPEATGHVWSASLPTGWFFLQLFWDGRPLSSAVSEMTDDWRQWPHCQLGKDPFREVRVPSLPKGDDLGNAVLNYMPTPYTRWANALAPVTAVDRRRRVVAHGTRKIHRPEKTIDIPYRFENVISGLTEPGRWFLDTRRGNILLWPPLDDQPTLHTVTAPWLSELIHIEGSEDRSARNLRIRGLTFRHTRGGEGSPNRQSGAVLETRRSFMPAAAALTLNNAEKCRIESCNYESLEGNAIEGGPSLRSVTISGCRIKDVGGGGILLTGRLGSGDYSCANNTVSNNVVHHCGKLFWNSSGICTIAAERTVITHNLIHDMTYVGIKTNGGARHTNFRGWPQKAPELERMWKQEGEGEPTIDKVKRFIPGHNRVEKNIIHNVMQVLDDGAGIYCHAGHHDSVRHNVVFATESPMGQGLYFDDEQMDSIMEGNLVYRCPETEKPYFRSAALFLHHNGRNRVVNNIFVGRKQVLDVPHGYGGHLIERNIFVWHSDPNWDWADPKPMEGAWDGRRQTGWVAGTPVARRNLWWHVEGKEAAADFLREWQRRGYGQKSIAADPKFAAKGLFVLRADSPAFSLGFVPLKIADAGPRG